ncbi:chemotaxis protein CheC [Alkalihalobacillus xiaoxiensis]|uniref:Chemotaxis protein CheC n=1 Tax=Shouchella xiaoxiensis TaxID=766895 RepID=A0ABS2SQ80_9BACI|nr:chemotaxis protein CheC [Shouchella xiaoxiensis]MBM7837670.1 chemotaxis protein CheC [Shouchella xiaoxiensis]
MTDQLDQIKEVANISTGHAATALSTFLNRRVTMDVPLAFHCQLEDLPRLSIGKAEECVAVYAPVEGEAGGGMFFITSMTAACLFVEQVLADPFREEAFHKNALAQSAFQEIGNIVIGSYLTAFSEMMNVSSYPLVTELSIDLCGALLAEGAFHVLEEESFVLMETEMQLNDTEQAMTGLLLFIPNSDTVKILTNQVPRPL